jgi:hypothetical protein
MRARLVVLGAVAGATLLCSTAIARTVVGHHGSDRITGTHAADVLRGDGGSDQLAGDCEHVRRG